MLRRDDVVAVRPVEAGDGMAARTSHGVNRLVAVVRRLIGSDDLRNVHVESADPFQRVFHAQTLQLKLLVVIHVQKIATAAFPN
jgi:hypothetical protein